MDFSNRNSRDIDFRHAKDVDYRNVPFASTSQSFGLIYEANLRSAFRNERHDIDRFNDLPVRSRNFDECSMESMERTHEDLDDFDFMDVVQYPIDKIRTARNALNAFDSGSRTENMNRGSYWSNQWSYRSPERRSSSHTRRERSPIRERAAQNSFDSRSRTESILRGTNRSDHRLHRSQNAERTIEYNHPRLNVSLQRQEKGEFTDRSYQPSSFKVNEPPVNPMIPLAMPTNAPENLQTSSFQTNPMPQAMPNLQTMVANLSQMIATSITQSLAQGKLPQVAEGIAQIMGASSIPNNAIVPSGFQGSQNSRIDQQINPESFTRHQEFRGSDQNQFNPESFTRHEVFRGSDLVLTQPQRFPELRERSPFFPGSQSPRRSRNRSPMHISRSPLRGSPYIPRLRSPISPQRSHFIARNRSRSPLDIIYLMNPRSRSPPRTRSPPRPLLRPNSGNRSPLNPRLRSPEPPQRISRKRRRNRIRNRPNRQKPQIHNSPSRIAEPTMNPNAILSKMAENVKAVQAMNSLPNPISVSDPPKPSTWPTNRPSTNQQHPKTSNKPTNHPNNTNQQPKNTNQHPKNKKQQPKNTNQQPKNINQQPNKSNQNPGNKPLDSHEKTILRKERRMRARNRRIEELTRKFLEIKQENSATGQATVPNDKAKAIPIIDNVAKVDTVPQVSH